MPKLASPSESWKLIQSFSGGKKGEGRGSTKDSYPPHTLSPEAEKRPPASGAGGLEGPGRGQRGSAPGETRFRTQFSSAEVQLGNLGAHF